MVILQWWHFETLRIPPVVEWIIAGISTHPVRIWDNLVIIDLEILLPIPYFIQGGIIHRCQHFRVSSLSLRRFNRQLPFFLLSRTQFITEHFPLHSQCLIRNPFGQPHLFLINLSVPHHTEIHKDTIPITFPIWILETDNRIWQIQRLALQQFITGKYVHHHISIFFRRTETEHGRMGSIKFRICTIEPHRRFYRRTFVLNREKNRVGVSSHFLALIIFHWCFQHIRSRWKILPVERHVFIRSKGSRCNRFLFQLLKVLVFGRVQVIIPLHLHRLSIQVLHFKHCFEGLILASLILQFHLQNQRTVSCRNHVRRRLCFTCHIGNSGLNGITIIYLIIILIRVTFLQTNRYREFSILIGHHFTGSNLHRFRKPPKAVCRTLYRIFHRKILKQHTTIRLYLTLHLYLITQFVTSLLLFKSDIKCRTFIIFYPNACTASSRFQRKHSVQTGRRQCEIGGKRTELIGTYRLLPYFLIVYIQ